MRNWISRVGCIFAAVLIMSPHAAAQAEEKVTLSELRESCQQEWHETYSTGIIIEHRVSCLTVAPDGI